MPQYGFKLRKQLKQLYYVKEFEVLTVASVRNITRIFCCVTLSNLVEIYRRTGRTYYLCLLLPTCA